MGMRAKCTKEEKEIADAYAKEWLWDFAVSLADTADAPFFTLIYSFLLASVSHCTFILQMTVKL